MSDPGTTVIRPMQEGDLERVLAWRNHPDIRRYMYTQHEISLVEHQLWFARARNDAARHLLIFEIDTGPMGFIQIHQLHAGRVADWGFYAAPDAPKGTGRLLGRDALHYAFQKVGLHKLCGQVLAHNERSIQFHLKLGFQREGLLREHHFDGERHHDVVCFGLLSREWLPEE